MRSSIPLGNLLFLVTYLTGSANSQALTAVSVPSLCSDICSPIVKLTSICDVNVEVAMPTDMGMDEMKAEIDCICNNKSFDVKSIMGLCASCMEQNAGSGDKTAVNNVNMILNACSFPTQSYTPSATSLLANVNVEATKPAIGLVMWTKPETLAALTGNKTNTTNSSMDGMKMGSAGTTSVGFLLTYFGVGVSLLLAML